MPELNEISQPSTSSKKRTHEVHDFDLSAELLKLSKSAFSMTRKEDSQQATMLVKTRDLGAASMLMNMWKSHIFSKDSYRLSRY